VTSNGYSPVPGLAAILLGHMYNMEFHVYTNTYNGSRQIIYRLDPLYAQISLSSTSR